MKSKELPKGFIEVLPTGLGRANHNTVFLHLLRLCRTIEYRWNEQNVRQLLLENIKRFLSDHKFGSNSDEISSFTEFIDNFDDSKHTLNDFIAGLVPFERQRLRILSDSDLIVETDDQSESRSASVMPVELVLDNIRSAFNVGSMFRVAECTGSSKLTLAGYTPTPADSKIQRSSMNCDSYVTWQHTATTLEYIDELRSRDVITYALETSPTAESCFDFTPSFPAAIILGNERYGLEKALIEHCDHILKIPVYGRKNSLNVATAASIVLYQFRRAWGD